ncbi:hypothetical protein QQF64_000140 [Cirrhinus molitorella]|uniref:Uncharacterized protein n=1 Tax=Cirrhinus molitorella TaxID=172907 RepID=A0ABR3NX17_9TELE
MPESPLIARSSQRGNTTSPLMHPSLLQGPLLGCHRVQPLSILQQGDIFPDILFLVGLSQLMDRSVMAGSRSGGLVFKSSPKCLAHLFIFYLSQGLF